MPSRELVLDTPTPSFYKSWIIKDRGRGGSKYQLVSRHMDTNAEVRSRAYATGPDFILNYLFLSCRGTGPIFVWKQFLTINIHVSSLKLSQLMMSLVPYYPKINISRVKINFQELVLLLVQLHSWKWSDGRCKYEQKPEGPGPNQAINSIYSWKYLIWDWSFLIE